MTLLAMTNNGNRSAAPFRLEPLRRPRRLLPQLLFYVPTGPGISQAKYLTLMAVPSCADRDKVLH